MQLKFAKLNGNQILISLLALLLILYTTQTRRDIAPGKFLIKIFGAELSVLLQFEKISQERVFNSLVAVE